MVVRGRGDFTTRCLRRVPVSGLCPVLPVSLLLEGLVSLFVVVLRERTFPFVPVRMVELGRHSLRTGVQGLVLVRIKGFPFYCFSLSYFHYEGTPPRRGGIRLYILEWTFLPGPLETGGRGSRGVCFFVGSDRFTNNYYVQNVYVTTLESWSFRSI